MAPEATDPTLDQLIEAIRACRRCRDAPDGVPLPHEPRPIVRASATARIAVFSQAPGVRVHASGIPFSDPSGVRLRAWMDVTPEELYDIRRVAIVPMGFCFPGHDSQGGDLPPRPECARQWRERVMAHMSGIELALLIGQHAQRWHLSVLRGQRLGDTMRHWRTLLETDRRPRLLPLPHPSWRNNAWLTRNPWFEAEVLPVLRHTVRQLLDTPKTLE